MSDTKVSDLTAISSIVATDLVEVSEDTGGGTFASKKGTWSQVKSFVLGTIYVLFAGPTAARTYTLPDADASLAILGANTFTGDQNLADNELLRARLQDCGFAFNDAGNVTSIDYTNGPAQRWAPTGTKTLTISNWPPSGTLGELLIKGVNLAAATLTWPTVNWVKPDGTTTTTLATYLTAASISLQSSGTDFVLIWTDDGGTTLYGKVIR